MAENIANRYDAYVDIAGDLPLDREDHTKFGAIANEHTILEAAHFLQSLGDLDVEVDQKVRNEEAVRRKVSVKEYFSESLKELFLTVDVLLELLENSTTKASDEQEVDGPQQYPRDFQKKESLLRGLFHITELGSYACFVGLLKLVSKSLDLPEYPFNAKREHVKVCLEEVEEWNRTLNKLVEKASKILQEIANGAQFNDTKAKEFDSTVRQANALIKLCKNFLSSAEKTINELMKIMSIIKVFSRTLRFGGLVVTWYGLYRLIPSSAIVDKLADYVPPTALSPTKHVGFAALCAFSAYTWLSFFPSRAYAFRDDLNGLKLKHERLTYCLRYLEEKLRIVVDEINRVN